MDDQRPGGGNKALGAVQPQRQAPQLGPLRVSATVIFLKVPFEPVTGAQHPSSRSFERSRSAAGRNSMR
jgi:hypothetical protein